MREQKQKRGWRQEIIQVIAEFTFRVDRDIEGDGAGDGGGSDTRYKYKWKGRSHRFKIW